MTQGTQVALAERWTRSAGANTISTTSDATQIYLNEGCREFAKRVHGIAMEQFISLHPKFEIGDDFAIQFSITGGDDALAATDVIVASSVLINETPTTVMNHLASNLNAAVVAGGGSGSVVMGWSASTWVFYLCPHGAATKIIATAPSNQTIYIDATNEIFGGPVTAATTTLVGAMPLNCNLEQSLPAGFLEMDYVQYDNVELQPAPFTNFMRPQTIGQPVWYSVDNKCIRLHPVPDHQGYFKIYYSGFPTDLDTDGGDTAVECPLPEEVHMAPVHWAAAKLFDEAHEFDKSIYHQRCFNDFCTDYKIREANNNPTLFPSRSDAIPPTVVS